MSMPSAVCGLQWLTHPPWRRLRPPRRCLDQPPFAFARIQPGRRPSADAAQSPHSCGFCRSSPPSRLSKRQASPASRRPEPRRRDLELPADDRHRGACELPRCPRHAVSVIVRARSSSSRPRQNVGMVGGDDERRGESGDGVRPKIAAKAAESGSCGIEARITTGYNLWKASSARSPGLSGRRNRRQSIK